jgi:hypothetical protein
MALQTESVNVMLSKARHSLALCVKTRLATQEE